MQPFPKPFPESWNPSELEAGNTKPVLKRHGIHKMQNGWNGQCYETLSKIAQNQSHKRGSLEAPWHINKNQWFQHLEKYLDFNGLNFVCPIDFSIPFLLESLFKNLWNISNYYFKVCPSKKIFPPWLLLNFSQVPQTRTMSRSAQVLYYRTLSRSATPPLRRWSGAQLQASSPTKSLWVTFRVVML